MLFFFLPPLYLIYYLFSLFPSFTLFCKQKKKRVTVKNYYFAFGFGLGTTSSSFQDIILTSDSWALILGWGLGDYIAAENRTQVRCIQGKCVTHSLAKRWPFIFLSLQGILFPLPSHNNTGYILLPPTNLKSYFLPDDTNQNCFYLVTSDGIWNLKKVILHSRGMHFSYIYTYIYLIIIQNYKYSIWYMLMLKTSLHQYLIEDVESVI